jgi:hypothetical protein
MKIAVTNHAVDRYRERVSGADGFQKESIRAEIRHIVNEGLEHGLVREHPLDHERRIIPFRSAESVLFLSIGPNTTDYEADLAVIGVLYEKEVSTGKIGLGVQLGDIYPELKKVKVTSDSPKFLLFIGPVKETIDRYYANDVEELRQTLDHRKPEPHRTTIYMKIE